MLKKIYLICIMFLATANIYGTSGTSRLGGDGNTFEKSVVFKAMNAELKRTTGKLKMKDNPAPYYVAYLVHDQNWLTIKTDFGGLISTTHDKARNLIITMRVGNYKLDNTNFISERGMGMFSGMSGYSTGPMDDNYDALQNSLWLGTDEQYKEALDILAQKKSAMKNQVITDIPDDFSKVTPTVYEGQETKLSVNEEEWVKYLKELSEVFKKFPKIQTSRINFSTGQENQYFIDSEGSKNTNGNLITSLEIIAKTQAKNGDPVKDLIGFYGRTPENLPDFKTITASVEEMAKNLSLETDIQKEIKYSGPVLFTDQAVGEFFFYLLGKGVSTSRTPIYENQMFAQFLPEENGFLTDKINQTILPASFSVYDDPTITEKNSIPLIGSFPIDDEGVKSQRVEIVKDGVLKNLLISRTPTKEGTKSNGHGRAITGDKTKASCANLFVESTDKQEKIKEKLINLCKEKKLDYGIVISRFTSSMTMEKEEMMLSFLSSFQEQGSKSLLPEPLYAYKLYTDGHTEPLRNIRLKEITPKVLKNIIGASSEENVCNLIIRDKFMRELPVSVITPSIIVDEIDITNQETRPVTLPVLPHPYFSGKK
ncbi:MAG: metallopeptidase TldD-related protein [bacterium]|nr:metallopeptidase TldD-related protein [bacterium]